MADVSQFGLAMNPGTSGFSATYGVSTVGPIRLEKILLEFPAGWMLVRVTDGPIS